VEQFKEWKLGDPPLTDRVLYCMVFLCTFAVGLSPLHLKMDKLKRVTIASRSQVRDLAIRGKTEALQTALNLLIRLAEHLFAAVANRTAVVLPAIGHFLGWTLAQLTLGETPFLFQLTSNSVLRDALLTTSKLSDASPTLGNLFALYNSLVLLRNTATGNEFVWPVYWEEEELRSALLGASLRGNSWLHLKKTTRRQLTYSSDAEVNSSLNEISRNALLLYRLCEAGSNLDQTSSPLSRRPVEQDQEASSLSLPGKSTSSQLNVASTSPSPSPLPAPPIESKSARARNSILGKRSAEQSLERPITEQEEMPESDSMETSNTRCTAPS